MRTSMLDAAPACAPGEPARAAAPGHRERVETLGAMCERPGGIGAVLNLFRAAKVRVAADAAALSDLVADPARKLELARCACEEAQHAWALLRRMTELGFRPFRPPPELDVVEGLLERSRARDVKRVYAERGVVNAAELMEVTVAVLIAERDTLDHLRAAHDVLGGDRATRLLVAALCEDEERHVACLEDWLAAFEQHFSPRAVTAARRRLEEVLAELAGRRRAALRGYLDLAAA